MKSRHPSSSRALFSLLLAVLFLIAPVVVVAGTWGDNGLLLRNTTEDDPAGAVVHAKLVKSEELLWVVWLDNRTDPVRYGGEVYVQAVYEEGIVAFPQGGIQLTELGWCPDPEAYDAVPDGEGGMIVCATDEDTESEPKFIMRYDQYAEPVWDEAVCIEDVLWSQKVQADNINGLLLLVGMLDEPSMLIASIDNDGSLDSWTIFEEPAARSTLPLAIVPRTSGFLALGRIVRTSNTSDCRRLVLSYSGQPAGSTNGVIFYWGRVNEIEAWALENNHAVCLVTGLYNILLSQYFTSMGYAMYDYMGEEIAGNDVMSFKACPDGDEGYWVLWRQVEDGQGSLLLNRFDDEPAPQLASLELTNSPANEPVLPITADSDGGVFCITRDEGATTPVVSQWDADGVRREGYETNIPLDEMELAAQVTAVQPAWHKFAVAYLQDRGGQGNTGLVVQAFPNAAPNTISESPHEAMPGKFGIEQAYPNPFNGETRVTVRSAVHEEIRLTLYDVLGRQAGRWTLEPGSAGELTKVLNLQALAGGVYILQAEQAGVVDRTRLVLVK